MNKKFFIPALIAAIFAASVPALAQDRGQYNGERRDGNWQQQRTQDGVVRERGGDGRMQDGNRGDDSRRGDYRRDGQRGDGWRDNDSRGDHRRDYQARYDDRRYRGAGPNHDLRRGARLPSSYHHRQYVVDNWRSHRLSAPPRGYHWVQAGDDYVLAAIATGIIAQIMLNN
jgi:Ni/Co efflux regulator RcnB